MIDISTQCKITSNKTT